MHILFLTDNFPPETNAPASRTFEHARQWVAMGHRVTVVTCAPNFPNGKIYDGYRNRLWQSEQMAGIRVIRVWSYMASNEGFIFRVVDFLSFMVSGFLAALFVSKPDVIVGTSPQFFTAMASWAAATVKRRPFVFELRDLWPESIKAVGAMRNSLILDILEKLELFLYRRAIAVVAVTESFKNNLIARGIDSDKIHVVTNGVDINRFHPMPRDTKLAAELDLEDCFVVGYIGTHGMAQALDKLLDSAAIIQNDPEAADIRILFLGDGAAREELMARAIAMNLTNVLFLASVSKEDVPRYWSILDVALIHLRRTELFKTVIPSKIFECMGMGVPILLGVEGEAAEIVNRSGAGVTVEPENSEEIASKIKYLRSNPQFRMRLSSAGVNSSNSFCRIQLANVMLEVLRKVNS
jgi:glycosyltransferase involved in cell wall biosynthesis